MICCGLCDGRWSILFFFFGSKNIFKMSDYNFLARFWIQAWALRSAGLGQSGSVHHRKYSVKRAEWAGNLSAEFDSVFFPFQLKWQQPHDSGATFLCSFFSDLSVKEIQTYISFKSDIFLIRSDLWDQKLRGFISSVETLGGTFETL